MGLKVYNSMSQEKEDFVPIEPGKVRMYCCGPTVYDFLHVGNFRGAVFYNFVSNWLKELGFEVDYVYNFTDVDDKIIQRAQSEGRTSKEISEKFIKEFWVDFKALKLAPHSHNPKVTDYIKEIIKLIQDIQDRGLAYVVEGEVFYSVEKFKDYGKLSSRKIEEMISGTRVQVNENKKKPLGLCFMEKILPRHGLLELSLGSGKTGMAY